MINAFRSNPAGLTLALTLTALLVALCVLWGPLTLLTVILP